MDKGLGVRVLTAAGFSAHATDDGVTVLDPVHESRAGGVLVVTDWRPTHLASNRAVWQFLDARS
jgi:hypothetical protein